MIKKRTFCSNCGHLTENIKSTYCPNCFSEERNEFNIIREYLRHYPRSNAIDIALATNVSINKITDYIRGNTLKQIN